MYVQSLQGVHKLFVSPEGDCPGQVHSGFSETEYQQGNVRGKSVYTKLNLMVAGQVLESHLPLASSQSVSVSVLGHSTGQRFFYNNSDNNGSLPMVVEAVA